MVSHDPESCFDAHVKAVLLQPLTDLILFLKLALINTLCLYGWTRLLAHVHYANLSGWVFARILQAGQDDLRAAGKEEQKAPQQ